MKQVRIEQVANGYIVNAGSHNFDSVCVRPDSDIHVFGSFGSMSLWLREHFEPAPKLTEPAITHIGNDEL